MIQFKRGKTASWAKQKTPLADGQPGYDKERHKIKIGDGKSSWNDLPNASGLFADEILDSEVNARNKARERTNSGLLNTLLSKVLNKEDRTIFTYGTETPDEETIGQVYLQYYDTKPEVDYIIESGVSDPWTYRIWKSGNVDCWCTYNLNTEIQEPLPGSNLFYNKVTFDALKYPTQFKFKSKPHETATLVSNGRLSWLASLKPNTIRQSGIYHVVSYQKSDASDYYITFNVHGKRDLTEEKAKNE
jgi:hypothetical protein